MVWQWFMLDHPPPRKTNAHKCAAGCSHGVFGPAFILFLHKLEILSKGLWSLWAGAESG